MATYRDRGIVLKTKTVRDADRHYTIFTEQHGKIVVLAKGSRRARSKLSPHLGGFGVIDLMIAKGRIIDRLAGAMLARPSKTVLGSLAKTSLAQSFLLAVDALTKRELPEERIFHLLDDFLAALDAVEPDQGRRGALFDAAAIQLLDILGFGLELRSCVRCRRPLVEDGNAVAIVRGGVECAACRDDLSPSISGDAVKALRYYRERPLATAASLILADAAKRETSFLIELLFSHHLEDRFSVFRYLKTIA